MAMDLVELQRRLGYTFREEALLRRALTHGSTKECKEDEDNETLEFLGDAFLQLSISAALIERYPQLQEGDLTMLRSSLVSRKALHVKGLELELQYFLFLSSQLRKHTDLERTSIISNSFEAVLGAVFIDGGYGAGTQVVLRLFAADLAKLDEGALTEVLDDCIDEKTKFYNYCRRTYHQYPTLVFREHQSKDPEQRFHCKVMVEGALVAEGSGKNKKGAALNAIRSLLTSDGENFALPVED